MDAPPVFIRGKVWCADLRSHGGQRRVSLDLAAGASQLLVGMAVQAKLTELRLARSIGKPTLPGLETGLALRGLVARYLEHRDYETDGGESYIRAHARQLVADIGHLTMADLTAPAGEDIIRAWRDRMWERGLANQTTKNRLALLRAILVWGQTGERKLTGPIPDFPNAVRKRQTLRSVLRGFWTEGDFRHLREGFGGGNGFLSRLQAGRRKEAAVFEDWLGQREMYLSIGFYTGMHSADIARVCGEDLSVDVGRYRRVNTKSARAIEPAWFTMPEQLREDCLSEIARRGRPWEPRESVTGGFWDYDKILTRAIARLWPQNGPGRWNDRLARRSMVREYTVRGWATHEIAALLGHADDRMVREIYRRCEEQGLISPVRVPWTIASGPHGEPTRTGAVLPFASHRM